MPLFSELFSGCHELEECLVKDSAHLVKGTKGYHVRLVQTALVRLGFGGIDGTEYLQGLYGPTTADAVLRFKTSRQIINFSYQTKPDNIVGKMTIARLDQETVAGELTPKFPL
jgi:peptidoglycan hydrolase-like protein with peptidoglycan-binding domain